MGNAASVHPELVRRGITPDVVTDQTPAHDLSSYVPLGDLEELDELRKENRDEYWKRTLDAIGKHVGAILEMQKKGAICFDYGNSLRAQAEKAGIKVRDERGEFRYPGFIPAYIRPLFCQGKGPFRWAALSGDPQDIHRTDQLVLARALPRRRASLQMDSPGGREGSLSRIAHPDMLARIWRSSQIRIGS